MTAQVFLHPFNFAGVSIMYLMPVTSAIWCITVNGWPGSELKDTWQDSIKLI